MQATFDPEESPAGLHRDINIARGQDRIGVSLLERNPAIAIVITIGNFVSSAGCSPQRRPEVTTEFIVVRFVDIRGAPGRLAIANRGKESAYTPLRDLFLLVIFLLEEF